MKINPRGYFYVVITLAAILCFYRIGVHDLSEWDEARNGMNALEMLRNGDYVNLYYAGEPDTWNAKPPLLTWLIVLCYKLFGLNEFALRLPVAISTVFFFGYFFKLIEMFAGNAKALATCLILFSCQAIFGWHMALNGDYDMLLLLFLTVSAYYFLQFIEFGKSYGIYLVAIFTGLAFYTKGPAAVLYTPAFVLYAILRGKASTLFKDYRTWISAAIFLLICGSWVLLVSLYGKTFDHSFYGSKNAVETMFVHDTFERLTNDEFDRGKAPNTDYFFVFHALDSTMNLWNYCFYIVLAAGIYHSYRRRHELKSILVRPSNKLILFACCILTPYFLILTFAQTKHPWYLGPAYGYVALITVSGVFYFMKKWEYVKWIFAGLFIFTFTRHAYYLHNSSSEMHFALNKEYPIFRSHDFIVTSGTPQHMLLYFSWMNIGFIRTKDANEIMTYPNKPLIIEKDRIKEFPEQKIKPIAYFENYCLAMIQ